MARAVGTLPHLYLRRQLGEAGRQRPIGLLARSEIVPRNRRKRTCQLWQIGEPSRLLQSRVTDESMITRGFRAWTART
jgi:hypothetical protein